MGAPHARHDVPAAGNGPLHPGVGRSPAGGIVLDRGPRTCRVLDSCPPGLSTVGGRRRSRGGAGRRQERRPERSREPARRSGAEPGA